MLPSWGKLVCYSHFPLSPPTMGVHRGPKLSSLIKVFWSRTPHIFRGWRWATVRKICSCLSQMRGSHLRGTLIFCGPCRGGLISPVPVRTAYIRGQISYLPSPCASPPPSLPSPPSSPRSSHWRKPLLSRITQLVSIVTTIDIRVVWRIILGGKSAPFLVKRPPALPPALTLPAEGALPRNPPAKMVGGGGQMREPPMKILLRPLMLVWEAGPLKMWWPPTPSRGV